MPITQRTVLVMSASESLSIIVMTAFCCACLFFATWKISASHPSLRSLWKRLDFGGKCDWCSRIPSVLHATGVLWFLFHELARLNIDENFQTKDNTWVLERNLCFSVGYFAYDACVILYSKMSLWQLYTFHHVAALWPLLSVLFGGCESYLVFACSFFLVEATIVPLQMVHWCESLKFVNSPLLTIGYHGTFWLWIPFRFILPPLLCYHCIWLFMPQDEVHGPVCKIALGEGGLSIWAFCWLIFFAHIGPGYFKRVLLGQKPAPVKADEEEPVAVRRQRPPPPQLLRAMKAKSGGGPQSPGSPMLSPTFKNGGS